MPETDWTVTAADRIEGAVGVVRDKAVVPITTAARWLVYGLLAAIVGTMALVLLAVALVRIIDSYLPEDVWGAHLVVGGMFVLGGAFLWSRRKAKDTK